MCETRRRIGENFDHVKQIRSRIAEGKKVVSRAQISTTYGSTDLYRKRELVVGPVRSERINRKICRFATHSVRHMHPPSNSAPIYDDYLCLPLKV